MSPRDSLSDPAKAVWDRLCAERGVPISAVTQDGYAAYATAIARLEDARARIDRDGLVVADDKGRPTPHPAIAIERSILADLGKLRQLLR